MPTPSVSPNSNLAIAVSSRRKTGGPKTAAGKGRSRLNALSHGFYARELVVSEADKPEFEQLRHSLGQSVTPVNAIQRIALDRLVSAAWRYKLVLRMEARRLKSNADFAEQPDSSTPLLVEPWFLTSLNEQRQIRTKLSELRDEVSRNGGIHLEAHQAWLTAAFGNRFYSALCDWRVKSPDAVLFQEHLVGHAKTFKMPLPAIEGGKITTAFDSRDRWQMVEKLIEMKILEMEEFHALQTVAPTQISLAQVEQGLESIIRYVTSAARELERAYEWYLSVSDPHR